MSMYCRKCPRIIEEDDIDLCPDCAEKAGRLTSEPMSKAEWDNSDSIAYALERCSTNDGLYISRVIRSLRTEILHLRSRVGELEREVENVCIKRDEAMAARDHWNAMLMEEREACAEAVGDVTVVNTCCIGAKYSAIAAIRARGKEA